MLEERVVARQGKPAGRNWAPTVLGPLTVEDLESFVAEVAAGFREERLARRRTG